MAVTSVRVARFVITGASMTEQARDLMREGDWKSALESLTKGLEGITYEQAISILEGKFKLESSNDSITMVDEDPEVGKRLQEEYASVFGMGGYLKKDNRMYQAYMVINNFGPEDGEAVRQLKGFPEALCGQWFDSIRTVHMKACWLSIFNQSAIELRGMYYASRPERDFARMVKNKEGKWIVVLFEEATTGSTPFWREKECTDAQAAYDQVAEYLPVHGYCQKFGYELSQVLAVQAGEEKVPQAPSPEEVADAQAKQAAEVAAAAQRAEERKAQCEAARQAVIDYADKDEEYGWFTYIWRDKSKIGPHEVLRAPKRALICYALSTTDSWHLMPEYKPFSAEGLKQADDNPYHTDVWLGCGLPVDDSAYNPKNPKYQAVLDMMFDMQKKLLNFEVQVMARGPEKTGRVAFADDPNISADSVLVVPHAGEEFHVQAMKAGAVICEVGGRLAHLVTVCREMGKPIIRMPDAMKKFKSGQTVTVTPEKGKVEVFARRITQLG